MFTETKFKFERKKTSSPTKLEWFRKAIYIYIYTFKFASETNRFFRNCKEKSSVIRTDGKKEKENGVFKSINKMKQLKRRTTNLGLMGYCAV